jgi:hypothetical protein
MLAHIALALLIQIIIARLCRSWAAGAAAATAWAVSREITQAEYRWIEQFGGGLRANMPVLGAFDLRVWQKPDPWMDWMVPALVACAVALVAGRYQLNKVPSSSRFTGK